VIANEAVIDITGLSVTNPNVAVEIPSGVTDVVIDGFTIQGSPTFHYADEAAIRAWDDEITISNNIFDAYIGVLYKGNDHFTASKNRMTVNKNGVVVQPNAATDVTISGDSFTLGTAPAADASPVYLTACNGVAISRNTASGFTGGPAVGGSTVTNALISGNTFTGNRDGISLWGTTTFVSMSGNVLSNNTRYGINIKGQDVTISGNDIFTNGDTGINVDKNVIATERVTVSGCRISGNVNYGVKVNTALVLLPSTPAGTGGVTRRVRITRP